jgi:serine/threonine-protein kinase
MPDSDLTQVGIFMGTPGYSPPEAIKEGRYTPQADVFAWGAVMYELMSGRIPYEGPDTKTTNGYVVQGNAPPPTRHDPSIPEPLSTVCMTALQPSDKQRFRDASEAEQALREAWERCLTQGLVHPSVLAMDELTHDKAPVRMHEPRGGAPRSSPLTLGDSSEMTAVNDKPGAYEAAASSRSDDAAHLAPGASRWDKPGKGAPLVIESSKGRPGDDDPTKLMVREEGKHKPDATVRGLGPSSKPTIDLKPGARASIESAADTKADPSIAKAASRAHRASRILVILLVAVLAAAAAGAGLYFGGMLG